MHVLIGTPTAGGMVNAIYAHTLFRTATAVKSSGGKAEFVTVDGGDAATARNFLANLFLRRPDMTHLLMIDSDMSLGGDVVLRLLRSDKPVVGAVCPKPHMDLRSLVQSVRGSDPDLGPAHLGALVLDYDVQLQPGVVEVVDGMCRVERLALGCTAIRRDAFEALVAAKVVQLRPDRTLETLGMEGPFYDFFGQIARKNGERVSEADSFCELWHSFPGHEIWAVVDASVGRVGNMVYGADSPFLNRLLLSATRTPAVDGAGAESEAS